jgi:hypothetical protein
MTSGAEWDPWRIGERMRLIGGSVRVPGTCHIDADLTQLVENGSESEIDVLLASSSAACLL